MKRYFVTGIGTDVGKTVVCAALAKGLGAAYWKPIQCGSLELSDSTIVTDLSLGKVEVFPEQYRFNAALSPDEAARREGVAIKLSDIKIPTTDSHLVIEGAGGLLVPINPNETIADLIHYLNAEIILVSKHYVGSINHTLLTLQELKRRGLKLRGIIFVGEDPAANEQSILRFSGGPIIATIPTVDKVTVDNINLWSEIFSNAIS